MFEMSSAIDKLAPALVAVQQATFGVERNAVNGGFKGSRYADLAATSAACREALTSNGFTVSQWPGEYDGKAMAMTTILLHASGQWMRGTMTVPLGKQDAQGYGSALTYARRYSLQAVVGLSPEDDDGNAAVRPVQNTAPAKITPAQAKKLCEVAGEVNADLAKFCGYYRIEAVPDLPAASYAGALAELEKKRTKVAA